MGLTIKLSTSAFQVGLARAFAQRLLRSSAIIAGTARSYNVQLNGIGLDWRYITYSFWLNANYYPGSKVD